MLIFFHKLKKAYLYLSKYSFLAISIITLSGCDSVFNKISDIGNGPELTKINIYENQFTPEKARVQAIAQTNYPAYASGNSNTNNIMQQKNANSLWQPGARTFFRARSIGDIVSVNILIQDRAQLDNRIQKSQNNDKSVGMPSLFGLESIASTILPKSSPPKRLIELESSSNSFGDGRINRRENINTVVAATVIKILPSGNLVIKGSQEVRVNFELREITISGIIRPEDIANDNSVTLDQIAEARLSYGGRGNVTQVQQAPYGVQAVDILSPF